MKRLLLALLFVSFSSALADAPAKIAEDYRKAAAAALVKVNETLEKATVPLIAALVKSGDTAGAEELREQLKAKTAGEPVMKPQASAGNIFKLYDAARVKALEPAQKAAVARIDALLSSKEGSKLEVVTELGKVRAEIDAGGAAVTAGNGSKNVLPSSWDYYSDPNLGQAVGELVWNADGTLALKGTKNNSTPGRWEATNNPQVFKVFFILGETGSILGETGSGCKYLTKTAIE